MSAAPRDRIAPSRMLATLRAGLVVPAMPLALDDDRRFDERYQAALANYYAAAGAGGIAVAVHTTQFEIRDPATRLLEPVLEVVADTLARTGGDLIRIAGVAGPTGQAVAEARLAERLGYDAVLLCPPMGGAMDEPGMLDRARAVAEVLPVIGFYLQEAVGGRRLSAEFWRGFAEIEGVVAIKIAPFDRYRTLDVVSAVLESGRADRIALYTGNDDNIVHDLTTPFETPDGDRWIDGGLLGQWAVGTNAAVRLMELVRAVRAGDAAKADLLSRRAPQLTVANAAVFDAANAFRGCIAGVNYVLWRQGLLPSIRCLSDREVLSPGQAEAIDDAFRRYPWLSDDDFVNEHRHGWFA
ncbi:dihydrodipicolinate synthase family protein [Polymorphospora sp. NPDC050346]|uniref:dihydrodipicolinate synthase family protein n=1 Tax=Polymorphospora sp. NPDC050346 TaxID=3155780 RepID=UPI0034036761